MRECNEQYLFFHHLWSPELYNTEELSVIVDESG